MLKQEISTKDALFLRKSVRKYQTDSAPFIPKELEARLCKKGRAFKPAVSDAECCFSIKSYEEMGKVVPLVTLNAKAPYYLIVNTETEKPHAYVDAGRLAQLLVIELATYGFGTCYQGIARVKPGKQDEFKLPYAIAVAFGWAQDSPYRTDVGKLSRVPLKELVTAGLEELEECSTTQCTCMKELLQVAQISPSALNKQPWRFTLDDGAIHVWRVKPAVLFGAMTGMDYLQQIDTGICLMQMELLAQENGILYSCSRRSVEPHGGPDGYLYEATFNVLGF